MQLTLPIPEIANQGWASPPFDRRIFCNRSLRLEGVEWVGFDMDFTLAIYRQEAMDELAIAVVVEKLVEELGYPALLREQRYEARFPIRGLLIDRRLGHVLKMDRYRFVKRAYHGMRELSAEERRRAYHTRRLRPASSRYHWVDTLYSLPEVAVFAGAVEALESDGQVVDYERLFADIRAKIDLAHRDGTILAPILDDLDRFVMRDPELEATLVAMREGGKKLFLLTNSQPDYTRRMMRHILPRGRADDIGWLSLFDLAICHARKPNFFDLEATTPFERVEGDTRVALEPGERLRSGTLYTGGNLVQLQRELGTIADRVLSVGDHIYGDVLSAKRETAWRTAMIVQEMEQELRAQREVEHAVARLDELDELGERLAEDLRVHAERVRELKRRAEIASLTPSQTADLVRDRRAAERLRARVRSLEEEHDLIHRGVSHRFHPYWGGLFKAGVELSSFGAQVESYAGLYTSRVSNFRAYSSAHFFHSPRDRMPHEL